jgi:RND family efflux transporter MFP subunit
MPRFVDGKCRPKSDEKSLSSIIMRQNYCPRVNFGRRMYGSIVAVASLVILAGCDAKPSPPAQSERPVQVQRVVFNQSNVVHEFSGIVRARYETDLGFRIAGKISARFVNAGDRVHVGGLIARLDPSDVQLQAESASAELTAATSNLDQATADLERYATLRSRGYASVADFERKKTVKDEAAGRVERARRSVELARNQLAYTDLRADAEGVITATLAEAGQVVGIGEAVVRLAQIGDKEAVVAIPESALSEARHSQATVRLWSDEDTRFSAKLRELSPQADPATRTYAARFTIFAADDAVAFGMTATVTLASPADAAVARLPLSSILNRGTGPSVFVVNQSGTLELRPVVVSSFSADHAVVSAGIHDGDQVVTLGVQKLEAGRKVRLIDP